MCDKKNKDKVNLSLDFSKSLKENLFKKLKAGYTFNRKELEKFPKLVNGKVEESSTFSSKQTALVSKLRQSVVPLYEDKAFFKKRIVNALDKLEQILRKESKSVSVRSSSSVSSNRGSVKVKTTKVHKTTAKKTSASVRSTSNNSSNNSNSQSSNSSRRSRRSTRNSTNNNSNLRHASFNFSTNNATNLLTTGLNRKSYAKINCNWVDICKDDPKTSAVGIADIVRKSMTECLKNQPASYKSSLKSEVKKQLNLIK